MRAAFIVAAILLAACSQTESRREPPTQASSRPALTAGEERAHISTTDGPAASLRSGPNIPVALPRGFTLYPGAVVVSNTLVERAGAQRVLLVFETADPIEKVMLHYRAEARLAGAELAVDLGGDERASLGGMLRSGANVTISARRTEARTRVEFAYG